MAKFAGLAKNGRERPFGYLSALIKRREGVGLKTHFIFSPSQRAQKLPQPPPFEPQVPLPLSCPASQYCRRPCIPAIVPQLEP